MQERSVWVCVPSPSSSPSFGRRCVSGGVPLYACRIAAPPLRQAPLCQPPPDVRHPSAWSPRSASPHGTCGMSSSPSNHSPQCIHLSTTLPRANRLGRVQKALIDGKVLTWKAERMLLIERVQVVPPPFESVFSCFVPTPHDITAHTTVAYRSALDKCCPPLAELHPT